MGTAGGGLSGLPGLFGVGCIVFLIDLSFIKPLT